MKKGKRETTEGIELPHQKASEYFEKNKITDTKEY